nr:hypothetical protein [Tanacetum cinerariifolium]
MADMTAPSSQAPVVAPPVPVTPSRSLEPPPTERQEDYNYGRQPIDQTTGYTITHDDVLQQDTQDESRFKYEVLDQEGRGSVYGVHVRYSEAFEDKEDLSQPGELYWRTRQRRRLQTFEAYRMIKSFWHSRPLSDNL